MERVIYVACLLSLIILALWGVSAFYEEAESAGLAALAIVVMMLGLFVSPLAFEWRRAAIERRARGEARAAALEEAERRREEVEAEERSASASGASAASDRPAS